MFKNLNKKKGQSTLEYAVLIIIVIAALLAMNTYIKRGLQGRLRSSADDIGDQFTPGTSNFIRKTKSHSKSTETFGLINQGVQNSVLVDLETTNVTTNGTLTGNLSKDLMPGGDFDN